MAGIDAAVGANLPVSWALAPLGEITRPARPKVRPADFPHLPFIGMEHVEAHTMRLLGTVPSRTMKSQAVHFFLGDVLYGRLRPYLNKVFRADFEGLCSAEFIVFPACDDLNGKYLQYLLNSSGFVSFAAHLNEGDRPRVDFTQLSGYLVPVAPLPEQRRIVAEIEKQFTRLDVAVAALERVQAMLKRYRVSVLKAACGGHLVPTEAELARAEGRSYETGERLLARILKKRSEKCEANRLDRTTAASRLGLATGRKARYSEPTFTNRDSLPAIPEGWTWAILAQIAELQGGITKGQKRRAGERVRKVPYLRVANVQRGFLDLTKVKQIEATEDEISQLRLLRGDVLFNEGGDRDKLGRGWVWGDEISECIHQNHVFRARLFLGDTQPRFISWYGNSLGQRYFLGEGKQTTNLASINLTKLSALPVPLPPADEQHRIVAEIESRFSFVASVEAAVELTLKRANRLRQAILKHAFEGRLVPQDPSEEPANILLERVRAARAAAEPTERGKPPQNRRTALAAESVS